VIGGLGGAVAETLGRLAPVPMDFIGVRDQFPESGPYMELLEKFGISAGEIELRARRLVRRSAP
jgi:transketolase